MDYKTIYWNVIKQAISREDIKGTKGIDYEVHHIIPKSIGGSNKTYNLVKLTIREHIFVHDILSHIGYNVSTCNNKKSLNYNTRKRALNNFISNPKNEYTIRKIAKRIQPFMRIFFSKGLSKKTLFNYTKRFIIHKHEINEMNDIINTFM